MSRGNGGIVGKAATTRNGVWTVEDVFLNRNGLFRIRSVSLASVLDGLSTDGLRLYGSLSSQGSLLARLNAEFTAKQYVEILCTDHDYSTYFVAMIGIGNTDVSTAKLVYANDGYMYTYPGGATAAYGASWGNGTRIGISYNPDNGKVRLWKDGTAQPEFDILASGYRYPAIMSGVNSYASYDFTFCVDEATIAHLPSGYLPFNRVR